MSLLEGVELDSVTVDGDAVTVTEGVAPIPYTGQELVITGTVTTETGTETVTYTFALDVDNEPLRLTVASGTGVSIDQTIKRVKGTRPDNMIMALDINRNGSRAAWNQKSKYSYKIKIGDGEWSDSIDISYNHSGCAIGVLAGYPVKVQVFYDNSSVHESSPVYTVDFESGVVVDPKVTLTSTSDNVTIDNTSRTVSVLADSETTIDFGISYDGEASANGNVYNFYCNKWLETIRNSVQTSRTAGDLAGSTKMLIVSMDDNVNTFGIVYDVNVNTQHVTLALDKIIDDPSSADVTITGTTTITGTASTSFNLIIGCAPADATLVVTLDGEPLTIGERNIITIPTSASEQTLYVKASHDGYVDTELTYAVTVTEAPEPEPTPDPDPDPTP